MNKVEISEYIDDLLKTYDFVIDGKHIKSINDYDFHFIEFILAKECLFEEIRKLIELGKDGVDAVREFGFDFVKNYEIPLNLTDARNLYGRKLKDYIIHGKAILTKDELKLLEKKIIKLGEPYYIINFAKNVKGADLEKLTDAICKVDDVYYIYKFGKAVKGANIEKLFYAVQESEDEKMMELFARDVLRPEAMKVFENLLLTVIDQGI